MGGLMSELQTMESGDALWNLVSREPLSNIVCDMTTRNNLQHAFFFHSNPSIRRVVTIATPHNGSNFSNVTTRWLGRKLISLPDELLKTRSLLYEQNPQAFPKEGLLSISTSVDALAPSSPAWEFFRTAERAPWVTYHNIIGSLEETKVLGTVAGKGDGIVRIESARVPNAASEIIVQAEHTEVHRQPAAILEVRRILLQHLSEMKAGYQPPLTHELISQAK